MHIVRYYGMGNMGGKWNRVQRRGRHFARTWQGEMEVDKEFGVSAILYAPCYKPSLLE